MFRFFILIYGLSLTEAYRIKVSGQVELGNQLSKLFRELYTHLAANGMNLSDFCLEDCVANQDNNFKYPRDPDPSKSQETDEDPSNERKRKKQKRKHKETDERDIPILDKMMQNDLEKLHLYGYHKFQEVKSGKPLNNVHL